MSVFSAAINLIFADPNMAADALWSEQGIAAAVPCRVIRKSPDDLTEFGSARIVSETTVVDIRVSEIAAPRANDRISIGSEVFRVNGKPRRDRERLVWTLDLVPG